MSYWQIGPKTFEGQWTRKNLSYLNDLFEWLFRVCTHDQYTYSIDEAYFTKENGRGDIYINGCSVYHGDIVWKIVV